VSALNYEIETDVEDDYVAMALSPEGTTSLNELEGRLEQNGFTPETEIQGYDVETKVYDDVIELRLDVAGEELDLQELADAKDEVHEYLDQPDLPDEVIERYAGGNDLAQEYGNQGVISDTNY
jgi:hypothetical protein